MWLPPSPRLLLLSCWVKTASVWCGGLPVVTTACKSASSCSAWASRVTALFVNNVNIVILNLIATMLSSFFASASVVGFSGSRRPLDAVASTALFSAIAAVPSSAKVVVGCATGVDAVVRLACPRAQVFSVASGQFGEGKSAFARRSTACVQAVAAAGSGGLWVSFPSGRCPAGLLPSSSSSRCFSGSGSGTWASLALAVGLGVPLLVFLPAGVVSPAGWGLAPVPGCDGWFSSVPVTAQLSLF